MALTFAVARPAVVSPEWTKLALRGPAGRQLDRERDARRTARYFLSLNFAFTFAVTFTYAALADWLGRGVGGCDLAVGVVAGPIGVAV